MNTIDGTTKATFTPVGDYIQYLNTIKMHYKGPVNLNEKEQGKCKVGQIIYPLKNCIFCSGNAQKYRFIWLYLNSIGYVLLSQFCNA